MAGKTLGDRMKDYESTSNLRLQRKIPVVGRLDGKAFHNLTKSLDRPFDDNFHSCMTYAAIQLCTKIQGCKVAYTQSDEITILLTDFDSVTTDAWFGYRVQKMCSVAASIATEAFTSEWMRLFEDRPKSGVAFDARFWNLPKEEVNNVFLWRQRDAEKNSITMLAQSHFSHKDLHKKNGSQKQDMLMSLTPPVNWNDLEIWKKRGSASHKVEHIVRETVRTSWEVDEAIPIFSKDPSYINQHLAPRKQ